MSFEIIDKSLAARIGRIYTAKGFLETPALLPVINVNFNPELIDWLKKLGYRGIITNAYLLWKKTGGKIFDIHEYLSFPYPVMTDSGGYQVLKYGSVDFSPKQSLLYQMKIKSDICVILDLPTGLTKDKELAKRSVTITLKRAKMAKKYIKESSSLFVAPIQGGIHYDLLRHCAKRLKELDYDIYAIGSPTGLMETYNYESVLKMILFSKIIIGPSKPMHLFGAGHPMFFPFIVAMGIDTFDSAAYDLYAKDDRYITRTRTFRIQELSELPCVCEICRRFSVKELLEMDKKEREKMLAKHNLYVSLEEIKTIRTFIREFSLWNYLEEKARSHPSLYRALLFLKKHVKYLEKYNPLTKANLRGIFLFDSLSALRPEIITYYEMFINNFKFHENSILIMLPFLRHKPFIRSKVSKFLTSKLSELDINIKNTIDLVYVGFPFILVPYELSETYPLAQWEGFIGSLRFKNVLNRMLEKIQNTSISKAVLITTPNYKTLFNKIEEILAKNKVPTLKISLSSLNLNIITQNISKILDFITK
jgi:tRNA-guanine transglycosylases, various specificities